MVLLATRKTVQYTGIIPPDSRYFFCKSPAMTLRHCLYLTGFALLLIIAPLAYQVDRAAMSLPVMEGEWPLPTLAAPVTVAFDALAIPTIEAHDRLDAARALGYLHAGERLFQMDMLRRKMAGRLAEIIGAPAVDLDRRQRSYRFGDAAAAILAGLPDDQRDVLRAYAEGVNAQMTRLPEFPPEFRFLHYRPEPWQPADSLLTALAMFQLLSDQEHDERMLSVMARCLPPELTAFLTPDDDVYAHTLTGGPDSRKPATPIPAKAVGKLLDTRPDRPLAQALVAPEPPSTGSNNWAVNGSRTADGRAIVADDMHLPLGVPNTWYRARLRFDSKALSGITLPGLPLVVVGSNGHLAWGFTNIDGDLLDLVRLTLNPANPSEYLTPNGWRAFDSRREIIRVKNGEDVSIETRSTLWGPVSPQPLLGQSIALHWTALDPSAVNLTLLDMAEAETLEQGLDLMNRVGIPPQNVVLADDHGRIGWTYAGFFPLRQGFDGSSQQSWADGTRGWRGYIAAAQLPRLIDPPEGYIATANNRTLGKDYPHIISHGFSNGYRAYRIRERLAARTQLNERDMLEIQLDTRSEFHEFYRTLALTLLDQDDHRADPELIDAERVIRGWNGRLDPDSTGIALLVRWRSDLARALFSPLLAECARSEPTFAYRWREQETPLRTWLSAQVPETLPQPHPAGWSGFLLDTLRQSLKDLKTEHQVRSLAELPWEKVNTVKIQHPFSQSHALAAGWLDMTPAPGACNGFCVKVLQGQHGASQRMVVAPDHLEDAILHMPGGQSGHPLSPHYRDQHPAWQQGEPLPFLPGAVEHALRLVPASPR